MIAVDTNILVYAQAGEGDDARHQMALRLVYDLTSSGAIIPVQVFGELANVCVRKLGMGPQKVINQLADYCWMFETPQTTMDHILAATTLASAHRLQFFDALIITVAAAAGATMLLSEDMQDGLEIEGLMVLDPFNPANAAAIAEQLAA